MDKVRSLDERLGEWNANKEGRTIKQAASLIAALQGELAGKEAVIDVLQEHVEYYKGERRQ